jgi:NADH dehydrogenase
MSEKQIVVLGGGFAGLWSALGAARKLDELGLGPDAVEVTLVNRDAFHNIRVRNYESDLTSIRVPLDDVLTPVGIRRVEGDVSDIDLTAQTVRVQTAAGGQTLPYDRLVFALGSQLVRPNIPGLAEFSFDVDTYNGAAKLNDHLQSLPTRPNSPEQFTVLVVGAGLTGIETATEMPGRLRDILTRADRTDSVRVILADHNPLVGSDMGDSARPVIQKALAALGVETRLGIEVVAVTPAGVTLKTGEQIPAATVIWCARMRANPLTRLFSGLVPPLEVRPARPDVAPDLSSELQAVPRSGETHVEHDRFGRLVVDEFLRVKGVAHVFAAGDVASAMMDDQHTSVMSCQHGRPMGRFAGHNVVCDLLNLPMLPLRIEWYVTVLDLGPWGAVYTEGWDRHVVTQGEAAKKTKQIINCQRIYPPLNRNRADILAAAAPTVQMPPAVNSQTA